jgi:aldose 1-epimerase
LDKHALHGLLYDAVFEVTQQQANDQQAMVVLTHAYRGTENGYPFYYDCTISYILENDNRLRIVTEIVNKDKGLIPIQDGWHPYFTLGNTIDDLQLEFQSKEKIVFDEGMIPAGETIAYQEFGSLKKIGDTNFDDCFSLNFAECQPLCVLRDTEQKIQVEIYPDKTYPYLQVYTPPHRKSIAIENLSAIPDAFNNGIGLITLAPQAKTNFTTTYKITSLK